MSDTSGAYPANGATGSAGSPHDDPPSGDDVRLLRIDVAGLRRDVSDLGRAHRRTEHDIRDLQVEVRRFSVRVAVVVAVVSVLSDAIGPWVKDAIYRIATH